MWLVEGRFLRHGGVAWVEVPAFRTDRGVAAPVWMSDRDAAAWRGVRVMSASIGRRSPRMYWVDLSDLGDGGGVAGGVAWRYMFDVSLDGVVSRGRPSRTVPCERCGVRVELRGSMDCGGCGASYNAFGQRLRDGWRGNPSAWDEDVSDLDGFEAQYAGDE